MKAKRKPIFLFDMDCSLFDYQSSMISRLNEMAENDTNIVADKENLWQLDNDLKFKVKIDKIKSTPGFWRDLPPIENGFEIYKHVKTLGFKIEILTKGPRRFPNAWGEKLECCQKHFGEKVNVNVVTTKKLFFGDILYDDFPSYLSDWLTFNDSSIAIMPVYHSNNKYFHNRLIRLDNNMDEVKNKITSFKERFDDNSEY